MQNKLNLKKYLIRGKKFFKKRFKKFAKVGASFFNEKKINELNINEHVLSQILVTFLKLLIFGCFFLKFWVHSWFKKTSRIKLLLFCFKVERTVEPN